jgi:hypothetical protein
MIQNHLHDGRADHAIKIDVGKTCIELAYSDAAFGARAQAAYAPFLSDRPADFRIEFTLRQNRSAQDVSALLADVSMTVDGDCFAAENLLQGRVDRAHHCVQIELEQALFDPRVEYRLMNFLLRAVYYSVYSQQWHQVPDAYLVHGCGIIINGRACLFTGVSGVGKTTLARLAGARTVLNDEIVLVSRDGPAYYLAGTPFDGGIAQRSGQRGELAAIFFLKHDVQLSRRRLSRPTAYWQLLAQTLDAAPLLEGSNTGILAARADFCAGLVGNIPCYELGFLPDTTVWSAVESEETG